MKAAYFDAVTLPAERCCLTEAFNQQQLILPG